ncbi:MAG: hypothetical protein Rhims3KO_13650 [Hyphomicrobiales bacterium]
MTAAGKITLRPFTGADVGALAALHVAARASMQLFAEPFTLGEHASYIAGLAIGCDITVAQMGQGPVGFIAFVRKTQGGLGLISHLFVHPDHQRKGVGAQLLDTTIEQHGLPLHLWVFEANSRARSLYESRGFEMTERTDGTSNEEGLPDLHYELRR